jgi:hypothetical protein
MPPATRSPEREEERRLNTRTLTIASVASATAAACTSQLWIAGTWIAAAVTPVLVALLSEALHRPTERIARAWTSDRDGRFTRAETATRAEPSAVTGTAGPVRVYRQTTRGVEQTRGAGPRTSSRATVAGADAGRPTAGRGADGGGRATGAGRGADGAGRGGAGAPARTSLERPTRFSRRRIAIGTVAATAAIAFVIGIVTLTTADLVSGGSVGKGSGRTTLLGGSKKSTDTKRDEQKQDSTQQQDEQQAPDRQQTTPSDQPTTTAPAPTEQTPSDTAPVPQTETPPGEPVPNSTP